MKAPENEIPGAGQQRTLTPPVSEVESTLPPTPEPDVEVLRFPGRTAQLAALSAQVRTLSQIKDKAVAAGRLARQLARRQLETRDALALGEKSLTITSDAELAFDVSGWWAEAGDHNRSVQLAEAIVNELPEERKSEALFSIARSHILLAHGEFAARTLRRITELWPQGPEAYEMFGALGFWSKLPKEECARAYLRAAEIRDHQGEKALALECRLRAFEVDSNCAEAAADLAECLRGTGRFGAADEVLREHLRSGASAQRAAHHQRAFHALWSTDDLETCFESALEAELDIDIDVSRVCSLVLQKQPLKQDFESFLWRLTLRGPWGQSNMLASWLLALCDVYRTIENDQQVVELGRYLVDQYQAEPLPFLNVTDNDDKVRGLRTRLGVDRDLDSQHELRFELARRLCLDAAWDEALLVLAPLLETEEVSVAVAAYGAVLGGRTSNVLTRVRALVSLAPWLPGPAGAVAYAVAAERLLDFGFFQEARKAADSAVEALPGSERAIATQALIALRAPDGASASLLEHSLSVLVARSDACSLLSDSASQRGSAVLALKWAGRALNLRPGDVECARRYLQRACAATDPAAGPLEHANLVEVMTAVLRHPIPVEGLREVVSDSLMLLRHSEKDVVNALGKKLVAMFSTDHVAVHQKLSQLAHSVGAHELLAKLVELQLISAKGSERAQLYLDLARYRLTAGEPGAAARALRRAQASAAPEHQLKTLIAEIRDQTDPDAELAVLEMSAELVEEVTPEERSQRLFVAGCARWDMAQDAELAAHYWLRAADLDKDHGLDLFAHYLRQFAGPESAVQYLKEAARGTEDPLRAGQLLGLAAREMLRLGKKSEAFQLAVAALERAPALSDLLTIAEAAADEVSLEELQRVYQLLADTALGNFGERAAHYRAARQLERRGALDAALRHACAAFEADPAQGVAYVLMARLAEATLGHPELLASLERVADRATTDAERGRWLSLAAALSDTESIGRKQRLEILWRAAAILPQMSTLEALFDGLAHCLADDPNNRDDLWSRFVVLARDNFVSARGVEGAKRCLAFSATSLTHFDQPDFALEGVVAAVRCDTAVVEYERVMPFVHQLAGIVGPATELVEMVRETDGRKDAPLGKALAHLASKIAELLGEGEIRLELTVRSASDFPEDASLVEEARQLAQQSGRADLMSQVDELLSTAERAHALLLRIDGLGNAEALDAILALDLSTLEPEVKRQILSQQARCQEAIGRLDDAAVSFRALLLQDGRSLDALLGLERHAEKHGNNEELLEILGRRIGLSQDLGEVRRLTLRRAAVLEMKMGRAPEARRLLQDFLAQGDDRAALRLLADSWERTGDYAEAAEFWERVSSVALDSIEADDAAFRAASCYSQAGTPHRANEVLSKIRTPALSHLELGLQVARSTAENTAVYSALVNLCDALLGDHPRQAKLLLEAAELASSSNLSEQALACAERLLFLLPHSVEAKLLVGRHRLISGALETSQKAEQMRELLSGTDALTQGSDREVAIFLQAKSLVVSGENLAACALLEKAIAELGERPLFAALLSELLSNDDSRALRLIDVALGAERRGFYADAELQLRGIVLARKLGEMERARSYLSAISHQDPVRIQALQIMDEHVVEPRTEHELQIGEFLETDLHLDSQAPEAALSDTGPAGENIDVSDAGANGDASDTAPPSMGTSALEAVRNAAREEHRRASRAALEQEELAGPSSRMSIRPSLRAVIASNQATTESVASISQILAEPAFDAARFNQGVSSSSTETAAIVEPGAVVGDGGIRSPVLEQTLVGRDVEEAVSDEELLTLFESGEVSAGLRLLEGLQADRSRSRDAVIVAQHLVLLDPGDAQLLGRLVTAAYRDGNEALAAAARHVLGAYGVGTYLKPPPLSEVQDHNEAGVSLLRQVIGPANEALSIVWEHASSFFKRELSDYGDSGLERIPFKASNLIGELCMGVSKVTGLTRTPVFRDSSSDEISIQVALLQPPAVIISGTIAELSPELVFHLGAMMAACAPEHALVFGANQQDVENVLSALALSFGVGRPEHRERPPAEITRVAAFLWETVPSRVQRRLSQLCAQPSELNYNALSGHSRLAVRRAGLIACGDLPTAIDDACLEYNLVPPRSLSELARVVAECPAALDLFQLSLSSEYAQIRFETLK